MAFGAVTPVVDGLRYKAFTIESPNVDAETTNVAVDLTTAGMTDFDSAPTSFGYTLVTGADNEVAQDYAITAATASAITINKITPTVALSANTNVILVWARVDRGISG